MAEDESLLHPLIQAGLPKARERIKYYKEKGLITLENGAVSLVKLAKQQSKDLLAREKRKATERAYQRLQQKVTALQK